MERRKHITKNIRHNRVAMLYWTLNDIFQSSAKQYDLTNLEEDWNGDTKYFSSVLVGTTMFNVRQCVYSDRGPLRPLYGRKPEMKML